MFTSFLAFIASVNFEMENWTMDEVTCTKTLYPKCSPVFLFSLLVFTLGRKTGPWMKLQKRFILSVHQFSCSLLVLTLRWKTEPWRTFQKNVVPYLKIAEQFSCSLLVLTLRWKTGPWRTFKKNVVPYLKIAEQFFCSLLVLTLRRKTGPWVTLQKVFLMLELVDSIIHHIAFQGKTVK